MSKYQNLDALKISMHFAKELYLLTTKYPRKEIYALTSQAKMATASVPSNIVKGNVGQYKKDPVQLLYMSRNSLYELDTLLNFAGMLGIITDEDFIKMLPLVDQNMHVLKRLIKIGKERI